MELIKLDLKENIIKFKVRCSKGTYIRTLCEDIAEKLKTKVKSVDTAIQRIKKKANKIKESIDS